MRRNVFAGLLVTALLLVHAPAASAGASASSLSAGSRLPAGQSLVSTSGRYRMVVQGDGNVVVYGDGAARWASRTRGAAAVLVLQGDGNLVLYASGHALWSTRTVGSGSTDRLIMQDDGNLVLYGVRGAVWVNGRLIPPLSVTHLAYSTGTSTQAVVVTAPAYGTSYATLEAFSKINGRWVRAFSPMPARIGRNGFAAPGAKREGDGRAPTGRFGFGAFMWGGLASPGVHYPYRRLVVGDWWDEHVGSSTYNTWRYDTRAVPPFAAGSEKLWQILPAYDYAATIGYNTAAPVQGLGSGIFLHVGTGGPTAGCVSVGASNLVAVLRWLTPTATPLIVMGTTSVVLT